MNLRYVQTHLKRTLTGIAAASMVLGTLAPMAFAGTSSMQWQHNTLNINGKAAISNVPSTVWGNTTYISVYDMQQYLSKMGYTATWNFNTMNIKVSGSPTTSGLSMVGNANIQINGTTVMKVNHMVAKPAGWAQASSFVPIYDFQQLLKALGISQQWDGATHTWSATTTPQAGTLAITGTPSSDVATGTQESLGLTNNGTAVTSGVTWSVSQNNGAVIDQMGNFVASAPGTYTVTASYEGKKATTSIVVYGQAAGVQLSGNSKLVADGSATETITATVVDANGNVVRNYNGTVNVATTNNGGALLVGPNTTDYATGKTTLTDVTVTNGVATFGVVGSSTSGDTDTVSVNGLMGGTNASNINYGSLSVTTVPAGAASLSITTNRPSMSVNTQTSAHVTATVQVEDATGAPYAGTEYATLTLTGPGSFSATSSVKTETVYTVGGVASATIYGTQGDAGSIVMTASAAGLTSGSITIPAYVNTAPAALKITSTPSKTSSGQAFTLYTVQLVDTNGNPVATNTAGLPADDSITISDNTATTGGALNYYTVSNGQPTATMQPMDTQLTNGQLQFAVENSSVASTNPTITIADNAYNFSATAPYSFQIGSAAQAALSVTSTDVAAGYVSAGQSVTFSAQLEDSAGNQVAEAGQNVTFYFGSNSAGATLPNGSSLVGAVNNTYVAQTNSQGVATITVNVPSSQTSGSFQVDANVQNGGMAASTSPVENVETAGNFATQMSFSGATPGSSYSFPTNNTLQVGGTDAVSGLYATLGNAVGGNVTTSDVLQVTTSNPAVLALNAYNTGSTTSDNVTAAGSVAALPTITGKQAGTATITVTDLSNPKVPALTETLTVVPGAVANQANIEVNGGEISSSNPLSVNANTPVQVTLVNSDAQGNPVPVTTSEANGGTSANFSLTDPNGGQFRLSQNGSSVGEVQIPVGQSSVTLWYVNPNTESITTPISGPIAIISQSKSTISTPATVTAGNDVTISGYVNDQNGNGMSGQSVTVSFAGSSTTTTTNANGYYSVSLLAKTAGSETATASVDGDTLTAVAATTVNPGALFSMSGLTYGSGSGLAAAGGTVAVTNPATGQDANGNTVAATGGTYTISGTPGTDKVSINASTGVITVGAGATATTYTVTYTLSGVTTTAQVTVS